MADSIIRYPAYPRMETVAALVMLFGKLSKTSPARFKLPPELPGQFIQPT